MDTTPTRHSPNVVLMLDQRLRRSSKIEPTWEVCTMFEGNPYCQYMLEVSCFEIPAVYNTIS